MSLELTHLSAVEYDSLLYGKMTPAMAAAYLQDGQIVLRTFAETLTKLYPGEDLSARLTEAFLSDDPNASPQSVTRRIRNWLSGHSQPTQREDIFRIAFALGLSEAQLDYLLGLCTDYGIQYRDGHDVIFAWFLRNGYKYTDAAEFFAQLPPPRGMNTLSDKITSRLTHELKIAFQSIPDTETLRTCYLNNIEQFGTHHLRAYYYFEKFIGQLIRPTSFSGSDEEKNYSIDAVMDTYLSLHVPAGRNLTGYSLIQKLIKQNWPNATLIKNILSHRADVPRKLLLLLYIVTENVSITESQYRENDEEYTSLQDRVEDHWWTLNAMLGDCGMALLDPRNATDWLVLYAICADRGESMSGRMEKVISRIFENIS